MHEAFTLEREEQLGELGGVARLWRHKQTGAQLLSVCNTDENKCFGVTLRTPPSDSTGVAHILEHSVLCGSAKYPVKEPFVELLKGSLQTFLNAMTFPDKTCYPVASANLHDFYNLVDVYIDAVFHPIISEDIFRQEGWHLEADSPEGPFAYKGVVYNEMKGVYSSPDSILAEQSQQSLFPSMCYGLDSGGNPNDIPKLTYKAFCDFHTEFYHPSNARFFFWGDDPEAKRLEILAQALEGYQAIHPHSAVPLQEPLKTPRSIEVAYAATGEEPKAHITMNWLLCDSSQVETLLALEILDHILLGLPGSPLRKALIDSGLGEDITGSGLETDLRQSFFSVGLRSVDPQRTHEVELLIMETLAELAETGVAAEAVEAAVNSLEFALREDNTGRFPRGLSAMIRCLGTWLYDGDPLAPLAWEGPLAAVKSRIAASERVFESLIDSLFLNNLHRSSVILLPQEGLAEQNQQQEMARLAKLLEPLSPAEKAELYAVGKALQAAQETPDSPEHLATIPALSLEDLPLRNQEIPGHLAEQQGLHLYTHNLPTSGIAYVNIVFPLDGVPASLLPLVPLFGRALTEMGTSKRDFVGLGLRLAADTGGIGADPMFATSHTSRQAVCGLVVSGKATRDKCEHLFALLGEVLCETRFDDQQRFMQMLLEERARVEQGLVPAGHSVVAARLKARFSQAGYLAELAGGVSYLYALRALVDKAAQDWPSVCADLESLRKALVRQSGMLVNLTADEALLAHITPLVHLLAAALPQGQAAGANLPSGRLDKGHEALLVPAQVNYVGKGCNLYDLGYTWHGSAHVVTRYMRMAWLWDQVRVQGGAYGVFCGLDRASGVWTQVSYRDPNVAKTLAAYDGAAGWLAGLKPDNRELTQAIVGAIGDLDSYMLPDAKGMASLMRHISDDAKEARQTMREEILGTTLQHFHAFGEAMQEAARKGVVCVLGGQAAAAQAELQGWAQEKLL